MKTTSKHSKIPTIITNAKGWCTLLPLMEQYIVQSINQNTRLFSKVSNVNVKMAALIYKSQGILLCVF